MLAAALAYISRGWPVLPLHRPSRTGEAPRCSCGSVKCASIGKHPIAALAPHGLTDATLDPREARQWWLRCPWANVAIVLGERSGMWALDVDPRHGGDRALEALCDHFGELPGTLHAFTGGGGDHYLFRWPGRRITSVAHRLGAGLDVKGQGGYIVAPPSLHASGERYRWDRPERPLDASPWLLQRVLPPPLATTSRSCSTSTSRPTRAEVLTRASAYLASMPPAISGSGGHQATIRAAVALVRGFDLAAEEALEVLLRDYNPRCRPPWSRAALLHKVRSAARADRVGRGYLLTERKGAA